MSADTLDLPSRLAHVLNRRPAVGLAVAIVRHRALASFAAHGLADVPSRRPVTRDTVFRIASITKTFTAVAVMQLWEQGLADLDAPANDYLSATLSVATKSFRSCRRQADISGGQQRDRRSNRRRRRGAARNSGRRCPRSGSSLAIAAGYEPLPRFAIEAWRGERSPQELLRDTLYRRMQALDRPAHRRERESPRLPHTLYRPSWRSRAEKPRSPWRRLIEY